MLLFCTYYTSPEWLNTFLCNNPTPIIIQGQKIKFSKNVTYVIFSKKRKYAQILLIAYD